MKQDFLDRIEASFNHVCKTLFNELQDDEALNVNLSGENTTFLRANRSHVRQSTWVEDGALYFNYYHNQRTSEFTVPLTGDVDTDLHRSRIALRELRRITPTLPEDPFMILPQNNGTSSEIHLGQLVEADDLPAALLAPAKGVDLTGIYAGGIMYRGNANSRGQHHWFATELASFDYSLMAPNEKAVKGTFATPSWDQDLYEKNLLLARQQLEILTKPSIVLKPGNYRTYLAPAAANEITTLLGNIFFRESGLHHGRSPAAKMREGHRLSPLLTLRENFKIGMTTRFNNLGEVAPEEVELIRQGELVQTLVSSRSAKEYGIISNGANFYETCRAPEILKGHLSHDEVLESLGTGLYLSNLHYLNWSDVTGARFTGMTRFACFWVEKGQIVGPIENLRFDDSVYNLLGANLEAITDFQEFCPQIGTYFQRNLGGNLVPGLLINQMTFTL